MNGNIIMVLIGGKNVNDELKRVILSHKNSEIIVITDRINASSVGRMVGALRKVAPKIRYYVFNENFPEENALKLFVLNRPDRIIVIGNSKPIEYILRIAKKNKIQRVV